MKGGRISWGNLQNKQTYKVAGLNFKENLSVEERKQRVIDGMKPYNAGDALANAKIIFKGAPEIETGPTPTPSITASNTPTPSITPSVTPTMTNTPTQTNTPTHTQTPTNTSTPTPTPTNASGVTEANAYLEAVVQAGGSVDASMSAATRTFFISIMANNLWDKLYSMYPYLGGVAASHAIDAKGGHNLTFNGGFTHSADGVQGNGISGYADTSYTGQNYFGTNPASAGVYVNLQGAGQRIYDLGVEGVSSLTDMLTIAAKRRSDAGNNTLFDHGDYPNGRADTTSEASASGMTIGSSTGTTRRDVYRNGTSIANQTANQAFEVANRNMFIFAQNSNAGANYYSDNRQAFCFLGSGMTASEVSAFTTAINTYQTSLGRNVY